MKTDFYGIRERQRTLLTTGFTAATWQSLHVYSAGDLVKPVTSNGHYYRCVTAGTSGATAPTWPITWWGTVTDGTVGWREEEPVNILDYDPVGFSYPAVILGDLAPGGEEQIGTGNQPLDSLSTVLRVIAYQGGTISKTWVNTRKQAFDVLGRVGEIIRAYPDLNSYAGVIAAMAGDWSAPPTAAPFYELQVLWRINLYLG